jgi:Mrp family chromosome partitioning ATPase
VQSIDAQVRELEARLDEEIARAVSAVAGEAAAARAREAEMASALAQLERRLSAQAERTLELRQLERVADADRSIYETFLARLNELTQQIGIQQADARVVSPAVPAEDPAGPNRKLIVIAATAFGLLAGAALVLAAEAARTSFLTDIDVTRRTGLRTIARLPRLGRRTTLQRVVQTANEDPFSPVGRAARDRKVALLGAANGRIRSILVTSATRREGCTTLSVLMANALARVGKQAVIVDCDFAEPTLSRTLDATAGPDVVDVLTGTASVDSAVRRDPTTGIRYLPVIDRKGYGPEVLYTGAFETMLARLRDSNDVVILDAAPLTISPDASAMSRMTDLVILAIRWGKTSEELVESALAQLGRGGADRVGAVLTMVNVRRERNYRTRVYNIRAV